MVGLQLIPTKGGNRTLGAAGYPRSMHSLNHRAKWAGAALALGLVASACGSEPATGSLDTQAVAEASSDSADSAEDAGAQPASAQHLFPDLDTRNIVDGSTVNFASELAGGDTPVLLWFWAPH